MPNIDYRIIEELARKKYVTEYIIYPRQNTNLLNYQVKLTNVPSFSKEDVVIVYNNQLIPHCVDLDLGKGNVWIKIPSFPANTPQRVYALTGNPSAQRLSKGREVFIVFDDFATGSTEQWTLTAGLTSDRITTHRLNINGQNSNMSGYLNLGYDPGDIEILYDYIRTTNNASSGYGVSLQDTLITGYPTGINDSMGAFDHRPGADNATKWNYLMNNGIVDNVTTVAGLYNNHWWAKFTRLENNYTYSGYSDATRNTQVWTVANGATGITSLKFVYIHQGLLDSTNNVQGWLTNFRIRKLITNEPIIIKNKTSNASLLINQLMRQG